MADQQTTVQVGKSKVIVAPQTKIFFVALVLIFFTKMFLLFSTGSFTPMNLFFILYFVLSGIWALIVVNCTVTGSCHLVAWIMSYVYLIVSFFVAFMGMSVLYKA